MASTVEGNIVQGPQIPFPFPDFGPGRYFFRRLLEHGDRIIQVFPELGPKEVSCLEIARRAASASLQLKALGIKQGDIIVVTSHMRPEFGPLVLGIWMRGAVVASINPFYDTDDFQRILDMLAPKLVVCEGGTTAAKIRAAKIRASVTPKYVIVEMSDAGGEIWKRFTSEDGNVDDEDSLVLPEVPGFLDKPVAILCSSGTTGLPKAVLLSPRNAFSQGLSLKYAEGLFEPGDVFMTFSPLFWVSGFLTPFSGMDTGNLLVMLTRFDEIEVAKTISNYKVSFLFMAPHTVVALTKHPKCRDYDLSSLRGIGISGASMDAVTQSAAEEVLGLRTQQWFGMTELMMVLGSTIKFPAPPGSVGKVLINSSAKVIDPETGKALGPNQSGELCFKGPQVMLGYYKNQEATDMMVDKEGWLHSGDIGYYDDEGFFYIADRNKDLIKFQGHHVAAKELEGVLLSHPGVKDAAVIGVPNLLDQEHPRGYVALQPGAKVTENELVKLVAGQLADFKHLRGGVRFLDRLPRTVTGKVARNELRALAKAEAGDKS